MIENQRSIPIRQTCIQISRYGNDIIELIDDQDNTQGQSKIRFRRFLILKAKSLIHEFEVMQKHDPEYVKEIVKHTSYFKKLKSFIEQNIEQPRENHV